MRGGFEYLRSTLTLNGRWPLWPWAIVLAVILIDSVWLLLTPLRLSPDSVSLLWQIIPFALLGTWGAARLDHWPRAQALFVGLGFILTAWPAFRLYNHLTMTTAFPLVDGTLAEADAMIGFNWFSYLAWLDGHPTLLKLMDYSYTGLTAYSIILFLLLLTTRHFGRSCRELTELFVMTAVACSSIGAFFPAVAAAVHYAPLAGTFTHIAPEVGAYHLDHLLALRTDPHHMLRLSDLPGLVTIPSFHTAMGITAIYCTRRSPWLFWPSFAVNSLMIASTPVYGSHYAIDIAAGALVSGICIAFLRRLYRSKEAAHQCGISEPVLQPEGSPVGAS